MICNAMQVRFRLLNGIVGWDPYLDGTSGVIGTDDTYGLRLNNRDEPRISSKVLSPFMPPAWLASGCKPGEWYVCGVNDSPTKPPFVLLQRDPCNKAWIDLKQRLSGSACLTHPLAIAASNRRLAVVDKHAEYKHRVLIWSIPDGRLAGLIELKPTDVPYAVAFTSWNEIVVSIHRENGTCPLTRLLLRFDLVGSPRGEIAISDGDAVAKQPLNRLRTAKDGSLWAAEGDVNGPFHLWRVALRRPTEQLCCEPRPCFKILRKTYSDFCHEALRRLTQEFAATRLTSVGQNYFCIKESTADGNCIEQYYDRAGTLFAASPASEKPTQQFNGTLETEAIDSFIPRCQWHRIRIDSEIPDDTSYTIEVATSETDRFRPDDLDWQVPAKNATDLLIDQPPGRYLFVRVRLTGTASTTPVLRQVRIDFPRVTSLNQLPAVYRDNAEAQDFTERFLSLFDAATEDLDRVIERFPALLDPDSEHEEVLNWLGGFVGIVFDQAWNIELRRKLLRAIPLLYRRRGTVAGLKQAIQLIFDVDPVIDEQPFRRSMGIVNHNARLGSLRLFGKSKARFRIGRSALGEAPIRSFGNPDHDPVREDAHRFTVLVPPVPAVESFGIERLNQLIEYQKPAHTQHRLRIGGQGFIVGRSSAVGIDSKLIPTAPPVLGGVLGAGQSGKQQGNIYLSRQAILRPDPRRRRSGIRVGITSTVGIHTVLE